VPEDVVVRWLRPAAGRLRDEADEVAPGWASYLMAEAPAARRLEADGTEPIRNPSRAAAGLRPAFVVAAPAETDPDRSRPTESEENVERLERLPRGLEAADVELHGPRQLDAQEYAGARSHEN